jgi:hypothetical protein
MACGNIRPTKILARDGAENCWDFILELEYLYGGVLLPR